MISNKAEEEATKTVPKPTEQDAPLDGEAGEEDGANPAKESDDKAPGPHEGPVNHDKDVLAEG